MREKVRTIFKQFLTWCVLPAAGLNLFIETLSRCSLWEAAGYLLTDPLIFLYNTLIIAATLSVTLLVRRRVFAGFLISLVWAVIGITDFVLLRFRTTPFTAVDLLMVKSAFSIMGHYLSIFEILLIFAGIALAAAGCVFLWKKAPKYRQAIPYPVAVPFCAGVVAVTLLLTNLGTHLGLLAVNFGNLADAFHSYGLPYCFMNSLLNTGIDKPDSYSTDLVESIVESLEQSTGAASSVEPGKEDFASSDEPGEGALSDTASSSEADSSSDTGQDASPAYPDTSVNILFLQLESFFDPTLIENLKYSEDPVPFYRYLKENYTTGYLNVPSIGAGTANTEFEVITGMNLDFFGPGEYPYKTILKQTTAESICYVLKSLGYATHAIHNNDATFYDRHIVFSQLGFDTFTPIEYMEQIEMTPLGWAKDSVLTEEIAKTLDSTQGADFIYTISVQGHGAYPETAVLEDPEITISIADEEADMEQSSTELQTLGSDSADDDAGGPFIEKEFPEASSSGYSSEEYSEEEYYGLLYYVNQLHEMDDFLRDLTDMLSKREEPVVLVLYGDHLPGFSFTEEDLENGNLYQTQYVMWSNFEMKREYRDLEAYQLYSYILGRLGTGDGLIMKLHQRYLNTEDANQEMYLEELEILEYDMLYGDLDCYGGENPYEPTELVLGVSPMEMESVTETASDDGNPTLRVEGRNFTSFSRIFVNEDELETVFLDSSTLLAQSPGIQDGDVITVRQVGKDHSVVGSTEEYAVTEHDIMK